MTHWTLPRAEPPSFTYFLTLLEYAIAQNVFEQSNTILFAIEHRHHQDLWRGESKRWATGARTVF